MGVGRIGVGAAGVGDSVRGRGVCQGSVGSSFTSGCTISNESWGSLLSVGPREELEPVVEMGLVVLL